MPSNWAFQSTLCKLLSCPFLGAVSDAPGLEQMVLLSSTSQIRDLASSFFGLFKHLPAADSQVVGSRYIRTAFEIS
jgi:hypothetical protein